MTGLILAAAGAGRRFRSPIPKQFVQDSDEPLYLRSLGPFLGFVEEVVLVVPQDWLDRVQEDAAARSADQARLLTVSGGKRRQDSVRRGLDALSAEVETVLVHDAARPFVSEALIGRVLEGVARCGACVPAIAIGDTVKEVGDGVVVRTLDRSRLRLVQTPQGFSVSLLRRACRQLDDETVEVTDESALVERLGHQVAVVPGERRNLKITWPEDGEGCGV